MDTRVNATMSAPHRMRPKNKIQVVVSDLSSLLQRVNSHPYQHSLEILTTVPLTGTLVSEALSEAPYYVVNTSLCDLFNSECWQRFNTSATCVYGLSVATPLYNSNTLCLLPCMTTSVDAPAEKGKGRDKRKDKKRDKAEPDVKTAERQAQKNVVHQVKLRVDDDTYEQLGLTGRRVRSQCHSHDICIEIDAQNWHAQDKRCARVQWAVRPERQMSNVSLLMAFQINKQVIEAPSHLIWPMTKLTIEQVEWEQNDPKVYVPEWTAIDFVQASHQAETIEHISEWIGLCVKRLVPLLSVETPSSSDEADSQLRAQERYSLPHCFTRLCSHKWGGFIVPMQVESILQEVHALVEDGKLPWAVLFVCGFADACVSFDNAPHEANLSDGNAENDFVVILKRGSPLLWMQFINEADIIR